MKHLFVVFVFGILACSSLQAAPFLICDPTNDSTITTFVYQEGTVVTKTPLLLASCHADLAAVPAGTHTYTAWFEDALGAKSVSVPFTFTRSIGGGPGPAGLRLSPN